jgi:uncharacterized iron-regulated protein
MTKPAARIAAALSIGLVTLASAATDEARVPPFNNIYDVAWVRSEDGTVSNLQKAADELSQYDVVFFGELHSHPGNHLAQMQLLQALHERFPDMTLSLEQFERDTQTLVDQYLAGEIGERVLRKEGRGWDNYVSSYRPLVEYAKANELPVITSNAPKNIVICVGKKGPEVLDEIPQPDRGWVAAELHVEEGAYMDKYMDFMVNTFSHGGKKEDPDAENEEDDGGKVEIPEAMRPMMMRSFSAQVTRDDTMAESIAMHLGDNAGRKVMHLDGFFHSDSHLGTVERLKMRLPELKIAVINPVTVEDNAAPAWTEEEMPAEFVDEDTQMAYEMEILQKRSGNTCDYGVQDAQPEKDKAQEHSS